MPIFRIESGRLSKLQVSALGKERELQRLLEANLREALGLHFLASEYTTTTGGRIDTIAVDEAGSPVIIEYKRSRDHNVINQALSYLRWLKGQKPGFFEKLMMDKLGAAAAGAIKLDWANPRVICIAESYNRFDIDTVEVVPLRIELLRYRFYEGGVFSLEDVLVTEETSSSSGRRVHTGPASAETAVEAPPMNGAGKGLFDELREWIMELDEAVVEKPTRTYVAYRMTKNFAEVHVQRGSLLVYLRPGDFSDPNGMIEAIPDSYNWTLNRRIRIGTAAELEPAKVLIEQSYRSVL